MRAISALSGDSELESVPVTDELPSGATGTAHRDRVVKD